jgi:hypothetical protein
MIVIALITGYVVGHIVLASGRVKRHYDDSVEIIDMS